MTSGSGPTRRKVLVLGTVAAGALGVGPAGVPAAASAEQRERVRVAVVLYGGFTALEMLSARTRRCCAGSRAFTW
ncbi:hypothetical protein AB0H17_23840 [Streptomyces olivoreticuli]